MTREELQRLYDEATGKYRAAGIARGYSAQAVPALLGALGDYLAEPDPTVEIAYLKAKLADVEAEVDNARRELGDVHVSLYSEIAMLTARAEAAEQTVRRVRAQCDSWSHGNSWNKAARNVILRALDGGAS